MPNRITKDATAADSSTLVEVTTSSQTIANAMLAAVFCRNAN